MKTKIINKNRNKRLIETVDFEFKSYSISGVLFKFEDEKYEVYFSKSDGKSILDIYYNVFDSKEEALSQYRLLNAKYKKEIY